MILNVLSFKLVHKLNTKFGIKLGIEHSQLPNFTKFKKSYQIFCRKRISMLTGIELNFEDFEIPKIKKWHIFCTFC